MSATFTMDGSPDAAGLTEAYVDYNKGEVTDPTTLGGMNMRAKRLKRAWVVRWRESNEDEAAVAAHRIYVLSARMGAVRVIEFMRALFVNCPTFLLNDRFRFMKRGFDWRSITSNSGSNIVIGDGPWICAWYVADFEAEWDELTESHVFRWTQRPGFRFDAANQKIETMGSESSVEVRVFNGAVDV